MQINGVHHINVETKDMDRTVKFYEENLGNTYTVLFEEDVDQGKIHGFTENYIRVAAKYDPMLVNELKQVTLDHINEKGNVEVLEPDFVFEKH